MTPLQYGVFKDSESLGQENRKSTSVETECSILSDAKATLINNLLCTMHTSLLIITDFKELTNSTTDRVYSLLSKQSCCLANISTGYCPTKQHPQVLTPSTLPPHGVIFVLAANANEESKVLNQSSQLVY